MKAAGRIEAMLKHSRKKMLQRQNKPLEKHASETFGVGIDESREAAQAGKRALAHEKPANSDADLACCDSVPTPNAVPLPLPDCRENSAFAWILERAGEYAGPMTPNA